jgi:hypothetical protein
VNTREKFLRAFYRSRYSTKFWLYFWCLRWKGRDKVNAYFGADFRARRVAERFWKGDFGYWG